MRNPQDFQPPDPAPSAALIVDDLFHSPTQALPPRPHPGVIQKLNAKMPRNQKLPGLYFLQSPALVPERGCQTVLICPSLRRSKRRQQEEPPPRPGLNLREEPELYRAALGSGQLRFPAREQCDLLSCPPPAHSSLHCFPPKKIN